MRREAGVSAHALTIPLLLTAGGKKMGKTEKGAVWIDGERLKPYDYYQYWVNVHDDDVIRLMKLYTFQPMDRIAELAKLTGADVRTAKHALAHAATALAHGDAAADAAAEAAKKAFSGASSVNMPTHAVALPVSVVDALVGSGLAKGVIDASCVLWAGKKRCVSVISE